MKEKVKEIWEKATQGEVTITKRELWLIALTCLFAGIVYGFLKAPYTHGVRIGCNNGCNNNLEKTNIENKSETQSKKTRENKEQN